MVNITLIETIFWPQI